VKRKDYTEAIDALVKLFREHARGARSLRFVSLKVKAGGFVSEYWMYRDLANEAAAKAMAYGVAIRLLRKAQESGG
jgi:hypothetical protein